MKRESLRYLQNANMVKEAFKSTKTFIEKVK